MFFRNVKRELADYIKEHMQEGHSVNKITDHLIYAGHEMDMIREAISLVGKDYETNTLDF